MTIPSTHFFSALKHGILPIRKAAGPTSHDLVALARKKLGLSAIGHAGTLDPFAEGLLVLLVGEATRLQDFFLHRDKIYEGTISFGIETDSGDPTGSTINEKAMAEWLPVSPETFLESCRNAVVKKFTGKILQKPPAHSAIKIAGKRAYSLARKGQAPEMPEREVTIHQFDLMKIEGEKVFFRVKVSSGTYIRSLARDLGETLGIPAHLSTLRRTAIGPAPSLREIDLECATQLSPAGAAPRILPIEDFVEVKTLIDFPLAAPELAPLFNGNISSLEKLFSGEGFFGVRVNGELVQIHHIEAGKRRLVYNLLSPAYR
ncbi:MAG: tRNA pseudouridine(55) synthase TruB [Spirochaetia bacterium]|nr:tRNA pseudouridine(55) synthase TruB [Spirochaetia bacterium]